MTGRCLAVQVNGVGIVKGVLVRDSKDFMVLRGDDGKITTVVKKWVTMFQVTDSAPRPTIYVYGIKGAGDKDTGIRFFRVGEKTEAEDGKTLLGAVSVKGKVFLLGEISELEISELKKSLDGTITGDI
jgi:hypothetical protein